MRDRFCTVNATAQHANLRCSVLVPAYAPWRRRLSLSLSSASPSFPTLPSVFFLYFLEFSDPFFSFLWVPSVLFWFLLAVSAYSSFFDLFQLPSAFLLPSTLQLPSASFSFLQLPVASSSFLSFLSFPQLPSASFSRHFYRFQLFEIKKRIGTVFLTNMNFFL